MKHQRLLSSFYQLRKEYKRFYSREGTRLHCKLRRLGLYPQLHQIPCRSNKLVSQQSRICLEHRPLAWLKLSNSYGPQGIMCTIFTLIKSSWPQEELRLLCKQL